MQYLALVCIGLAVGCSAKSLTPTKFTADIFAMPEFDRASWGGWVDADHDCLDTRQEVLIKTSQIDVTLDSSGCKVLRGQWACPYTGNLITNPNLLDVSPLVPLEEAHLSGAYTWSKRKKSRYLNNLVLEHLQVVDKATNRSRGPRQPHEWMPPNKEFHCEYVKIWLKTKRIWNLSFDCIEAQSLSSKMGQCLFPQYIGTY